MGNFIVSMEKDEEDRVMKNEKVRKFFRKNLGRCVFALPFDQSTIIDFTGPPGSVSGIYYSLTFQLGKWGYRVARPDEWIEVNPVHAQYYQLTQQQKHELEQRIKTGLASVGQAVADMELLKHDERKYKEFVNYLNANDVHALKSVFVDMVDAHTGEGISLRSIVSRWPTIITDFMRMPDIEDPNKLKEELKISKAEAVVLVTKNKLYNQWRKLFDSEVRARLERIQTLVRAREQSVNQYKEWLKPYIARHKLLEEGLSSKGGRAFKRTHFVPSIGQAVSSNAVTLWTWRGLESPEIMKVPHELLAKENLTTFEGCYDEWLQKEVIFHPKHGLVADYPWITNKWARETAKDVYSSLMSKDDIYYSFCEIELTRTNIKLPTGFELEDGWFIINNAFMSQNIMLAKLMELKAKEEEFEQYVNKLVGVSYFNYGEAKSYVEEQLEKRKKGKKIKDEDIIDGLVKKFEGVGVDKDSAKELFNRVKGVPLPNSFASFLGDLVDNLGLGDFMFFKPKGPYEKDLKDRITKFYLIPLAKNRYAPIINFLKQKIGYGES